MVKKTRKVAAITRLTDEGLHIVFTDIIGRVAIQHYANLIGIVDPQLSKDLSAAVEAAGGWGDRELNEAVNPKHKHKWVSAKNEVVSSGDVCLSCGTIREGVVPNAD